jgi:predicted Zn-dependent peptidase
MEQPGLVIVYAAHLPDRDQTKVRRALLDEVARVRNEPVSATELDKAKNQLASGFMFGLETVDGVATQLGQYQYVYGDWHEFVKGATRYLAVTARDVQRVAAKYLTDSNLTFVALQPRSLSAPVVPGAAK